VDVQLRMPAGGNWDFATPPLQRRLAKGDKTAYEFSLRRIKAGFDRPVVEAVVHWTDPRGRHHEIVLPRAISVSPAVEIAVEKNVPLDGKEGWTGVPAGNVVAWDVRPEAPQKADPQIALRADEERLLIRVRVEDAAKSYWPDMRLDPRWGGIASDAVSISFARGQGVDRVWVLPFAAGGPEIWANQGLGEKQAPLTRLPVDSAVQAIAQADDQGYVLTMALPRAMVFPDAAAQSQPAPRATTALINVSVHDNDEGAMTWTKSWANEEAGPAAWARVTLLPPAAHSAGEK
jgi:hypothetical protein